MGRRKENFLVSLDKWFSTRDRITRRQLLLEAAGAAGVGTILSLIYKQSSEKPGSGEIEIDNSILFNQLDIKWQQDPSWGNGISSCGPTTIAMVLARFGEKGINPAVVDRIFQSKGIRIGPNGSTWFRGNPEEKDVVTWLRKDKNYQVLELFDSIFDPQKKLDLKDAKSMINNKNLIIGSGLPEWLGRADHIFGISDVDIDTRRFMVFDPWGGTNSVKNISDANLTYLYAVKPAIKK